MDNEFVIQQVVSVVGVLVLIALAGWAKIGRKLDDLDEAKARALFAEEFPTAHVDAVWLADDGKGAVAKAGDQALILTVLGDGYVARAAAWSEVAAATPKAGNLSIRLRDIAAPRVSVVMSNWPPKKAPA